MTLMDRLAAGETLLCDGAMGTMLFERGLEPGQCPESVNLGSPDFLREIADAYLQAGANILMSNTFGGSPLKLALYGLDAKTEEINAAAVRAVREAAGDEAFVAVSCGPCGGMLEPYGELESAKVRDSFERQLAAACGEGVDLICVETMMDLSEAVLAVEAARSVAPGTPVSATMTFDETPAGFRTIMGVSIEQAAEGLRQAGADIVGSNCGNGILNMVKIAREFRSHTNLPVIIQSNAGLPEARAGELTYPETPTYMADRVCDLLEIGVAIVGGCCGTTPDHIAAFRRAIDVHTQRRQ